MFTGSCESNRVGFRAIGRRMQCGWGWRCGARLNGSRLTGAFQ